MSAQKVMIAIDESEHSERALQYYTDHIHRDGNEVILIHCVETPYVPSSASSGLTVMAALETARLQAKEIEDKYRKELKGRGIECKLLLSEFHHQAGDFIVESANKEQVKLIVMGSRGLGTIRRTILGSVSDYVIHHAHCPVVVCKK